jgi:D-serine deaminase-like pyridoxal phosphate-dependent protein
LRIIDLETPALLVDYDKMLRNIKDMQAVASRNGLLLRPHSKTHKCPEIAKIQLDEGASGICTQKLSEAETMVDAGIKDIFVTNEIVQPAKIERLVKLQQRASVKVAVDSLKNAEAIGSIGASDGQTVPVMVEVDCGMGRCGVPFGPRLTKLVRSVSRIAGLRLDGLTTFEGQFYNVRDVKRRTLLAKRAVHRFVQAAKQIRKTGMKIPVLSCGSTPTARAVADVDGVTELQPGNYVFYDVMQAELGSAKLDDCAQRVLTTVISKPLPGRLVVDAGTKAFSHDQGRFPRPLDAKGMKAVEIHEEHLTLKVRGSSLRIGDQVQFVPYHACTATNMFEQIHAVRGSELLATWAVSARGKMN